MIQAEKLYNEIKNIVDTYNNDSELDLTWLNLILSISSPDTYFRLISEWNRIIDDDVDEVYTILPYIYGNMNCK